MFDWITNWLENKIIEWLAKQVGVDPAFLKSIITEVIQFLAKIFEAFDTKHQQAAFFRNVGGDKQLVSKDLFKEKLKEIEEIL